MYGQRNIPQIFAFCKDIREVGEGEALLLNYANPIAMSSWAATEYGGVPWWGCATGCRAGTTRSQSDRALVNKGRKPDSRAYRKVSYRDVDIVAAGINHQTWYIQVRFDGEDWTGRLLAGAERHSVYSRTEKIRIDILRRFGYYTTESNGHVSEYVPWYRKRPGEIRQ